MQNRLFGGNGVESEASTLEVDNGKLSSVSHRS